MIGKNIKYIYLHKNLQSNNDSLSVRKVEWKMNFVIYGCITEVSKVFVRCPLHSSFRRLFYIGYWFLRPFCFGYTWK